MADGGIEQLLGAGREHGYIAPQRQWRGDKLLRAALLAASIHPRGLIDFVMALACDEEEALRWAAIDLAFSRVLRERLFRASREGSVDLTPSQLKAELGRIVDLALETEGFHPWMQREFLDRFHREHVGPILDALEDRFTLSDFPIARQLIGSALGQESVFAALHPEVRNSERKLRGHVSRIILVLPPISVGADALLTSQTSTPPLGLGMIGGQLLARGHDVQLIDCHRDSSLTAKVVDAASDYQWIGFNAVLPTMRSVLTMASEIKKRTATAIIVVGGPAVNARAFRGAASNDLERACWDFEITAHAEKNFVHLVEEVTQRPSVPLLKGIVPNPRSPHVIRTIQSISLESGSSEGNSSNWPETVILDRRIFASKGIIYEPQSTRAYGRAVEAHVVMSRGCDWNCTFCTERKSQSGGEWRRPVKEVVEELRELSRRHEDLRIQFVDDNLFPQIGTLPPHDRTGRAKYLDWAEHFLNELTCIRSRSSDRFGWRGIFRVEDFLAYEDAIEDFIGRLAKSGCRMLALGIEHGNEERRRKIKVGPSASNADFIDLFRRLAKAGINTKGYFILGGLKETVDTSEQTIRFALESGVSVAYFAIYKDFVPALKILSQEQPSETSAHVQYSEYEQMKIGWDEIFMAAQGNAKDPAFLSFIRQLSQLGPVDDHKNILNTYNELSELGFRFSDLVKYSDSHAADGAAAEVLRKVNFGDQSIFEAKLASAYLRFYMRPEFINTYKVLLSRGY